MLLQSIIAIWTARTKLAKIYEICSVYYRYENEQLKDRVSASVDTLPKIYDSSDL